MASYNTPRDANADAVLRAAQTVLAEVKSATAQLEATAARAAKAAEPGIARAPGAGAAPSVGRAAAAEDGLYGAASRGTRSVPELSSQIQRLSGVQAVASEQMKRHGALTTEFLGALARGEVTIADFGYHIAGTIGKFAGWTAAAGAVYGALGAVKELGTGARDAASGTDALARFLDHVDTSKAQQGFRNVSGELNVSIKEVADTQASFARIFKDQDQSLSAARISLLATKLDNVSTADSYRFLTGIVQEFQLPASQLPILFDQISAAQRRAGGRVSELLPAVARSAAAVKNAGGDLRELIALANTAQVASGQTGQSVGTAFYRAPRFVQKNSDIIKGFGLDPNEGFTKLLIDAVHKTKDLPGDQKRKLAEAIGGPQLGDRIFAPLLNRSKLLDKSLGVTDPAKAQGSAQEELKHKLAQVDEQISSIGNNLQRLGSALAQGGFFQFLGLGLKLLNSTLSAVTGIVEAFDKLPGPLREALVILAEIKAASIITRTQIGAGLADRTGLAFLGPSPQQRATRSASQSLGRQSEQLLGAQAGATVQAEAAALRARALAEQEIILQDRLALAKGQEVTVLEEEIAHNRTQQNALQATANEQEALAAIYAKQLVETKAQLLNIKRGALEVDAELVASGQTEAQLVEEAAASQVRVAEAQRAATVAAGETAAATGETAVAAEEAAAAQAAGAEAAGLGLVSAGTARLGGAMGLLRAGLSKFVGVGITAAIGYELVSQAMKDSTESMLKQAQKVSEASTTADQVKTNAALAAKTYKSGGGIGGGIADFFAGITLNESPSDTKRNAALAALANDAQIARARAKTGGSPFQQVDRSYDELTTEFKQDLAAYKAHQISKKEFERRIAELQRSAAVGLEATQAGKDPRAFQQQIAQQAYRALGPSQSDPFQQFRGDQAPKDTQKFLQQITDRAQAQGRSPDFKTLARGFVFATQKWSATSGQNLKDLITAQDIFDKAVTQSVQDELKAGLATTTDPNARRALYDHAISQVKTAEGALNSSIGAAGKALVKAQADLKTAEAQQKTLAGIAAGGGPGSERFGDTQIANDQNIAALKTRIASLARNKKRASDRVKREQQQLNDLLQQLKQQQFQDYSSNLDIQASFQESQTTDKVSQIKTALYFDELLVEQAIKDFGAHSKEALQAITKANGDRQRLVDEQRSRLQSGNELATSQIQTPGTAGDHARLQSDLNGFYKLLAYDRAHHADITQINADLIQINNARRQLADQARKDAQDLYDSKVDAAIAATDDPIKKARLELQKDTHDLRGLHGADYYKQLAKVRGDKTTLNQAIINEDLDQARFEYDTQQISSDQYIAQLKNILKLKGITKQMKRQILEQIYQIENGDTSQLSLNVDQIRVPTLYEVRRALASSAPGNFPNGNGPVQVAQSNNINIQITGAKEGVKELATALEGLIGGGVEAGLRASGAI